MKMQLENYFFKFFFKRRPPLERQDLSQGSEVSKSPKKGALAPNADYELWYLDESEFHLHPYLMRMWMPKGKQKRVRSPGVNRKQTAFGAFCYGRGLFYYHLQPRKTAWGVRVLLQKLLRRARRTGRWSIWRRF